MENDESQKPGKRPRLKATYEELQQAVESKDENIYILNKKCDFLLTENEKLQKSLEELIAKFENNEESEESTSEDEMVTDEVEIANSQGNLKANVKSDIQPKATTSLGKTEEAVKVVPSRATILKEVPGSSQKKPEEVNNVKKSSKSVPIVTTYNVNVRDIISRLDGILGHKEYNIKILGKNVTNIGVCTLEDFVKLKDMLKEQGVNYYTHTPRSQRPFSVVIRGLSDSFETGEVLQYMQGLQISVRILGLHKLGGDRWLLQVARDSDTRGLSDIRYILHCKVTMTRHTRRGVVQCYNCQRFGHVAINCNMPYRCVKCGGDHGPGKCAVPPRERNTAEVVTTDPVTGQAVKKVGLPVRCVNCNVEGHAASARECPKRQGLVQKLSVKKSDRGNVRVANTVPTNRTTSGVSYAAAARGVANRAATGAGISVASAGAEFDVIDRDCKRLLGGDLLACLSKMKGFAREYKLLGSDGERTRALLGMLISLQHDG